MDELLPCPFCGGAAELYQDKGQAGAEAVWLVYCDRCLAQGPDKPKRDQAVKAWNSRA
jgi:Lar family restriction alleviation protein